VLAAVERHGLRALLTRADHVSGTDRLAEVVEVRLERRHRSWSMCRATSP
jgi:CMP-2-keto-3-deoxyoctulosonic acid synthetase